MNNHLLALVGIISSLEINFRPSANGCNKPNGPARLGPGRSCKMAATLRSPNVVYNAIPKLAKTIMAIIISFSMINAQSNESNVML